MQTTWPSTERLFTYNNMNNDTTKKDRRLFFPQTCSSSGGHYVIATGGQRAIHATRNENDLLIMHIRNAIQTLLIIYDMSKYFLILFLASFDCTTVTEKVNMF